MSLCDKKVLICFSPFKGTLTSHEAVSVASEVLRARGIAHDCLELADGGGGTLDVIQNAKGGEIALMLVKDLKNDPVMAPVLCFPNAKSPTHIVLESATVCGLHLLSVDQLNPYAVTSEGFGILIRTCLERWAKSLTKVSLGLGDTANVDCGLGMLVGMGFSCIDAGGKPIALSAKNLTSVDQISPPPPWFVELADQIQFEVLCDINHPLPGAQRTFARQKGATPEQIELLERGCEHFAQVAQRCGYPARSAEAGAGAAGGLGFALATFLGARLRSGSETILDLIGFDEKLRTHDVLITGEGRTDEQTLLGKPPFVCWKRAQAANKSTIFISGTFSPGVTQLFRSNPDVTCEPTGIGPPDAKLALREAVERILRGS